MLKPRYVKKSYHYEMLTIFLLGFFIVISCALYSYNKQDISCIYYTTHPAASMHNWCGVLGAHGAALLFYLIGSATWLAWVLYAGIMYARITGSLIAYELDRLAAAVILVVVGASFCTLYGIDSEGNPFPGGLIGGACIRLLCYLFEYVGCTVFLYVLLYACCVILFRFSFIGGASWLVAQGRAVIVWMHTYRVWDRCMAMGSMIVAWGVVPFNALCHFLMTLLDGSAFDGTTFMVPAYLDEDNVKHAEHKEIKEPCLPEKEDEMQENSAFYTLPHKSFFIEHKGKKESDAVTQEWEERAILLQEKLERFGIKGKVVAIKRGPVVTLFEYEPLCDAPLSKIVAREDDLAMALKAHSIRILAPIPGRSVVGFEVSNTHRGEVLLADTIHSPEYTQSTHALPLILGKDTVGTTVMVDLASMPHLLIAGSTGSGKSVGLNGMLISLLCARTPDQLKLILIDPKRLEFSAYEHIAHLLFPIITDTKQAVPILKWVVHEMDERYKKMAACGVRTVADYNAQVIRHKNDEPLPFIVVIIDELADLMITVGREVENSLARITQMARAAGIHLIVATQRPSVDVITGFIKVNFPSRISFRVTSRIDSRTILDCGGADKLLGKGDMLFLDATTATLKRVHGAYVSDKEIASVADHIRNQRTVLYRDITQELLKEKMTNGDDDKDDFLYEQVVQFLDEVEVLSISQLQRKFKIGYNRSARIIEQLESSGRLMAINGGRIRRVIK